MKRINLTIVVSSLTIGGAEQLLLELLKHINREQFNVKLIFLRQLGILGKEIQSLLFPIKTNILNSRFDMLGVFKLAKELSNSKTDILFLINHLNTLFFGVLSGKIARIPAIINWHNETFKKYPYHNLTMFGRRILHSGIDKVVAAAMGHKDYIEKYEKIPSYKVDTIYNGVDPEKFKSDFSPSYLKCELGIPDNSNVIAIIAALRPDKAHHIFLDAAKIILQNIPETHFLIIGDGPERNKLESLSKDLDIDKYVHFLGFQRGLAKIFKIIDVKCLSSNPEQETLSVAAMEAMSAGIPVVSTDVGFMKEIVIPEKTGYLVPVGDYNSLAKFVIKLLKDKNLRNNMGKSAQKLIYDRHSYKNLAIEFEKLFKKCIKEGAA